MDRLVRGIYVRHASHEVKPGSFNCVLLFIANRKPIHSSGAFADQLVQARGYSPKDKRTQEVCVRDKDL